MFPIVPPAVTELGTSAGFEFYLKDEGGKGHDALIAARNQLLGMAAQDKRLTGMRPGGSEDSPQYRLDIDAERASALGVTLDNVNDTLALAWGGRYIDDFIDRGKLKRVYVQGDAPFRMQPADFDRWYVRSDTGTMVPISAFTTAHWEYGSPELDRFNGVPAVDINGEAAHGVSSGTAMKAIEEIVAKLPARLPDRLDRAVLPGARRRRTDADPLYDVGDHRVPGAGRALRELGDADSYPDGRAVGHHRRGAGHRAPGPRARCVFPGRHADDHRTGEQERNPDRRICQAQHGCRTWA